MIGPVPRLYGFVPRPYSDALPRSYAVTVRNPLANLTQVVEAEVRFGTGTSTLDAPTFTLAPGESRTLNLTSGDVLAAGDANLTLASDLGGWEAFDLPIVAPPPANTTAAAPPAKDSPASSAGALVPLLWAAVALRRRRQP